MKTYLVGGAVRDRMLGEAVGDRDWVVVGAAPEELEDQGYKQIGKDFPVFIHPETGEQYALARTERKSGKGYKGFTFHTSKSVTLEDDLARRDLTINAMAEDQDGNLIDPFGGKQDLEKKILRHVSPAFAEDPLRVLRVARFAARFAFHVAGETLQLMRELSALGELEYLQPERVWNELVAALKAPHPARFVLTLRACGAFDTLFPEIERLFGVPQRKKFHPEIDAGVHTLMTLEQAARASDDPLVRFAALTHDLGKGTTPKMELPSHVGHEKRGVKIIKKLCKRYSAPNNYRNLATQVSRHHLHCHRIKEMRPATILKKLEALDAFRRPERFESFLICCEADYHGRTGFEERDYPQADYFRKTREAAVNINTAKLVARGLKDKAMREAIRSARIKAITKVARLYKGNKNPAQ